LHPNTSEPATRTCNQSAPIGGPDFRAGPAGLSTSLPAAAMARAAIAAAAAVAAGMVAMRPGKVL
jgi:hypothetical protein